MKKNFFLMIAVVLVMALLTGCAGGILAAGRCRLFLLATACAAKQHQQSQ